MLQGFPNLRVWYALAEEIVVKRTDAIELPTQLRAMPPVLQILFL